MLKVLLLIFLSAFAAFSTAQNSFIKELKQYGVYDIVEDDKGCFMVILEHGIVRINPFGNILWDKKRNGPITVQNIKDSGAYIFGSTSTEFGGYNMLSIGYNGEILWDKYNIPSEHKDTFQTIVDFIDDPSRKQYIVAGGKFWPTSKTYYWIAAVDYRGTIKWEKYWNDPGQSRYFRHIFKNGKTGGYLLVSNDEKYPDRHELINVDSLGNVLNRAPVEPNPEAGTNGYSDYELYNIGQLSDSFLVATVENPQRHVYFYKYDMDLNLVDTIFGGTDGINRISHNRIVTWGAEGMAIYNSSLQMQWLKLIYPLDRNTESIYIKKVAKSRDGGFYGIAEGERILSFEPLIKEDVIYIFKTDSMGNIMPQHEYREKQEAVMLQPNPARDAVRIAIPYYYGTIKAQFYDMYGRFLFEKTQNEQIAYDIRTLAKGMYVVKATIVETGEQRTMKLILE